MGVPKFYRWLSERYPCLSQVIKEHQIPEFDNLYLDMNGIIHPCSHPNDDDPHFRITEAQIFKNIFNYIEVLFRIIKPKRNFFMAVDGCAPRAKMNQQRSRRFRTAKEAEDNIRKALLKGQTLPSEERFDSNCITPGTDFMARLQIQLKYFVNKKISSDPLWQNVNVYLSGHDVPGEGEHKVMDFIRYCKSRPGYDPNTRHCLYGLDADLVMLGLTAHEPHFALLREEVRFGKQAKRLTRPEEQTFHLLHLSLLREYIDFEFGSLKEKGTPQDVDVKNQPSLHFPYDLERLIDDWILLGFLVGNDFVPHLPHMHINHDALPYLFAVYKDFIVTTDGYINDGGNINLLRLKKFFELLSKFDRDRFEEVYADLKWLESKGAGKLLEENKKKKFSDFLGSLAENEPKPSPVKENRFAALQNMTGAYADDTTSKKPVKILSKNDEIEDEDDDDDVEVEDEETFELEFKQHKRHYYMEKFDMDIVDDEQVKTICHEYVRALQWIAHYYFNGLQSWSWYYPYHYTPYISDVANFEVRELHFDMAKPFQPFEQLLAVLPAASKKLLPIAFQHLMIMDNSPLIDFYPPDFRTDLNGKQQEWEAVVLIPFIDESRLLRAMLPNYSHLTDEEKERNAFGKCFKFTYDKTLNFVYTSAYPEHFPDITICRTKVEEFDREHFHLPTGMLKKGLLEGTKLDVYFTGFPTMKHIKHQAYLKKAGVKVFQQNSRSHNTIVKILTDKHESIEDIAKTLVGETAYVEWPYMVEAMVTSVCNDSLRYYLDHNNQLASKMLGGEEYKAVKREMKGIESYHMERRGVELGEVKVLVEAKLLLGQRYICGQKGKVTLEKEWSPRSNFYGHQVTVKNLSVHGGEVEVFKSIDTLYKPGTSVFMMASPHYGSSGEVIECDIQAGRVRVALKVIPEPDFTDIIEKYDSLSVHYISDRAVAQRLSISPQLLGRITGDVRVTDDTRHTDKPQVLANIGLKLKYSGQNKEVLGFARRGRNGWTYSPLTIKVLQAYMDRFPDVFEALAKHENYGFSVLFPKRNKNYLDEIQKFLKEQPCAKIQPVRCGSTTLDEPIVMQIEDCVDQLDQKTKDQKKIVKVKLKPHLLFRPTEQFGKLSPDPATEFLLFDRVVSIQNGITVPTGLRGTIIGIHAVLSDENDKESPVELRYEVLFDEPFLGAIISRSKEKRGYFIGSNSLVNISYGERKDREKKGIPLSTPMSFQNKISQTNGNASSPYTPRTPGIIHTPKSRDSPRDNSNRHRPQSSEKHVQNSGNKKDQGLVTPDYWLKGSYGKGNQQAPTQQFQPLNQQKPNKAGSPAFNNQQQMGDNNDFMNMWKEMQKTEQQQQQPNVPKGSVEEQNAAATATLHKMLHIQTTRGANNSRSSPVASKPSPKQQQQQGRGSPKPQRPSLALQHMCAQAKLPLPQYAYSKTQQGVSALVMVGHQYRFGGTICSTQQQAADSAAAIALSQIEKGTSQDVDVKNQPQFRNPQQVPLVSPVQPTSQFFPIAPVPVGIPIQPLLINQQQQQQQQLQQRQQQQVYQKPAQYQSGARHSSSPRYQQPGGGYNKQHQHRSKSNQEIHNSAEKKNPFVPHQVMVKNNPSSSAPDLTTMSLSSNGLASIPPPTSTNASHQLKDMLGIQGSKNQDDELKDLIGVPPPKSRDEQLMELIGVPTKDQQLKNLIGVQNAATTTNPTKTTALKQLIGVGKGVESQDDILKNLIGVTHQFPSANQLQGNTTSQEIVNQHSVNQPQVDGNKLKEILGLTSPDQSSNQTTPQHEEDEDDILARPLATSPVDQAAMSDALLSMLITPKTASASVTSPTPNQKQLPKPQLPMKTSPNSHVTSTSPAPPATTSPPQEDSTKKKKQILLAPSFFGPKKK